MNKTIVMRCLQGVVVGIAIATVIPIILSMIIGDGQYHAVAPALVAEFGTELYAVVVQTVCAGACGALWGGLSVIWDVEQWSLLRRTLAHAIPGVCGTFAIAYMLHWVGRNIVNILLFFLIFFGIYVCIWIAQYLMIKRQLQQINQRLS